MSYNVIHYRIRNLKHLEKGPMKLWHCGKRMKSPPIVQNEAHTIFLPK